MATLDELKNVLKETLDQKGVLNSIKARIRSEIFQALDEEDRSKPGLSAENLIINELIREYLDFNQYKHTLSVMMAETGQPQEKLERNFLSHELNIVEDANSLKVPLLYSIVGKMQSAKTTFIGGKNTEPITSVVPDMRSSSKRQDALRQQQHQHQDMLDESVEGELVRTLERSLGAKGGKGHTAGAGVGEDDFSGDGPQPFIID